MVQTERRFLPKRK